MYDFTKFDNSYEYIYKLYLRKLPIQILWKTLKKG